MMIEMKNISKVYKRSDNQLNILNDINIKIENGEFLSIMGPSGSGKSTLMNILGCLDRPSNGSFFLNGENLSNHNDERLAEIRNLSIGFVFQNFQLLPRMTALRNVELPMIYAGVKKKERFERAKKALEKVGLKDRMYHLPNSLSGGQKQRVAIARSIVNNPKLLLADEPTGALDSQSSKKIMEKFTELNNEGTTVVIVTHEIEIADYTSRTINILDGQVINDIKRSKGN
jgi:putative ABC transport system ATP-binding protein